MVRSSAAAPATASVSEQLHAATDATRTRLTLPPMPQEQVARSAHNDKPHSEACTALVLWRPRDFLGAPAKTRAATTVNVAKVLGGCKPARMAALAVRMACELGPCS